MHTKSFTIVKDSKGGFAIMQTSVFWTIASGGIATVTNMEIELMERDIETYEKAEAQIKFWYDIV